MVVSIVDLEMGNKIRGRSRGGLRDFHMELVQRNVLTDISTSPLFLLLRFLLGWFFAAIWIRETPSLLRRHSVLTPSETYQPGDS